MRYRITKVKKLKNKPLNKSISQIVLYIMSGEITLCYICLSGGTELVRPCANSVCTARTHRDCLMTQFNFNNKNCGNCFQPIFITKNLPNKYYSRTVHKFTILIMGLAIVFFLAYISTAFASLLGCYDSAIVSQLDMINVLATACSLFFSTFLNHIFLFLCGNSLFVSISRKLDRSGIIQTPSVVLVIIYLLIVFVHMVGFCSIECFTCNVFIIGLIIYLLGVFLAIAIILLYGLHICITDVFDQTKWVEFGIVVKNDT